MHIMQHTHAGSQIRQVDLVKKETIVVGLGNPLMSDEGIGGFLIDRFKKMYNLPQNVNFVDGGTGGLNLLYIIEGYKKAVIIDCAYMGSAAGTIRHFKPEDVQTVKQLSGQSLHEADVLGIIEMAKQLGRCPENIVIFGIEPETIEPGIGLSDTLKAGVDNYLAEIVNELK